MGYKCVVKRCTTLNDGKTSFFRFPRGDLRRCYNWLALCDREDLLDRGVEYYYKCLRICARHFRPSMFLNDLQNRVQPHAKPVLHVPNNILYYALTGGRKPWRCSPVEKYKDNHVYVASKSKPAIDMTEGHCFPEVVTNDISDPSKVEFNGVLNVDDSSFTEVATNEISDAHKVELNRMLNVNESLFTEVVMDEISDPSKVELNGMLNVNKSSFTEVVMDEISVPPTVELNGKLNVNESSFTEDVTNGISDPPKVELNGMLNVNESSFTEVVMDEISAPPKVELTDSCRICLSHFNNMKYLLNGDDETLVLIAMLESLVNFEVQMNDVLSAYICLDCESKLKSAYEFQQLCLKSHGKIVSLKTETPTDLHVPLEVNQWNPCDIKLKDEIEESPMILSNKIIDECDSSGEISLQQCQNIAQQTDHDYVKILKTEPLLMDTLESKETTKNVRDDGRTFQCPHCSFTCRQIFTLTQHTSVHGEKDEKIRKRHVCIVCSRRFSSVKLLTKHSANVHNTVT